MTDCIDPAVSAFEWRTFRGHGKDQLLPRYFAHCAHANMIAKHNDALPDTDPRKITREKVELIRDGVQQIAAAVDDMRPSSEKADARALSVALGAFADALESYLPPE